jgi:hypothetical protein
MFIELVRMFFMDAMRDWQASIASRVTLYGQLSPNSSKYDMTTSMAEIILNPFPLLSHVNHNNQGYD